MPSALACFVEATAKFAAQAVERASSPNRNVSLRGRSAR